MQRQVIRQGRALTALPYPFRASSHLNQWEQRTCIKPPPNSGGRADGNRKQRGSRALTASALGVEGNESTCMNS
jgi:hypothetical protein